ncbi:MAG: AAA family ATPase [Candidatus Pacearchaeota archaeon]
MLESATFLKDYRCFKEGFSLSFRKGINVLVGDQGTGKSSLLQLLGEPCKKEDRKEFLKIKTSEKMSTAYFDTEKHNPRLRGPNPNGTSEAYLAGIQMMWMSHGEVNNIVLSHLPKKTPALILVDEPDTALSPKSIVKLVGTYQDLSLKGYQFIVSIHNPLFMSLVGEVLDISTGKWIDAKKYLKKQIGFDV